MAKNKVSDFIRENAFYLVLGLCVIAIGISLMLMFTVGSTKKLDYGNNVEVVNEDVKTDSENITPTIPSEPASKIIEFVLPVENGSVAKDYTDAVCFNATLNRYEKHQAIDYVGEDGAKVIAVYDGKIESVTTSITKGITVVIDHGDGLKTVYNSLADGNDVWEGKSVLQGDVIGSISTTNRQEYKDGAHLHFEVVLNGEAVSPYTYFIDDENK